MCHKSQSQHLTWSIRNLPLEETTPHLAIMKQLAVDFSFALLLLVDLALALAAQPFPGMHPDALLRGMSSSPRRTVHRHRATGLPLYMMQLYRTMLTDERAMTPPANVSHHAEMDDNPALHESDSVISLVAKSEYSTSGEKNLLFF